MWWVPSSWSCGRAASPTGSASSNSTCTGRGPTLTPLRATGCGPATATSASSGTARSRTRPPTWSCAAWRSRRARRTATARAARAAASTSATRTGRCSSSSRTRAEDPRQRARTLARHLPDRARQEPVEAAARDLAHQAPDPPAVDAEVHDARRHVDQVSAAHELHLGAHARAVAQRVVLLHRVEAAAEPLRLPAERRERALGEVAAVAHVGVVALHARVEAGVVEKGGAEQQLPVGVVPRVLRQPLGDQELAHAMALHRAVGLAADRPQGGERGALD